MSLRFERPLAVAAYLAADVGRWAQPWGDGGIDPAVRRGLEAWGDAALSGLGHVPPGLVVALWRFGETRRHDPVDGAASAAVAELLRNRRAAGEVIRTVAAPPARRRFVAWLGCLWVSVEGRDAGAFDGPVFAPTAVRAGIDAWSIGRTPRRIGEVDAWAERGREAARSWLRRAARYFADPGTQAANGECFHRGHSGSARSRPTASAPGELLDAACLEIAIAFASARSQPQVETTQRRLRAVHTRRLASTSGRARAGIAGIRTGGRFESPGDIVPSEFAYPRLVRLQRGLEGRMLAYERLGDDVDVLRVTVRCAILVDSPMLARGAGLSGLTTARALTVRLIDDISRVVPEVATLAIRAEVLAFGVDPDRPRVWDLPLPLPPDAVDLPFYARPQIGGAPGLFPEFFGAWLACGLPASVRRSGDLSDGPSSEFTTPGPAHGPRLEGERRVGLEPADIARLTRREAPSEVLALFVLASRAFLEGGWVQSRASFERSLDLRGRRHGARGARDGCMVLVHDDGAWGVAVRASAGRAPSRCTPQRAASIGRLGAHFAAACLLGTGVRAFGERVDPADATSDDAFEGGLVPVAPPDSTRGAP